MLEEGSKPRPARAGVKDPARARRSRRAGGFLAILAPILVALAFALLILAANWPAIHLELLPILARNYWLAAAATVVICLGLGKEVQFSAARDIAGLRFSGDVLTVVGADCGLASGILFGIGRAEPWQAQGGFTALFLANAIIAAALSGRRLIAGPRPSAHAGETAASASAIVEPGALIPFDGVINQGRSEIDEGIIGGSPLGALRGAGDTVRRGARNGDGRLVIEPLVEPMTAAIPPEAPAAFSPDFDRRARLILIGSLAIAVALALSSTAIGLARPALGFLAVAVATPPALGLARPLVNAKARSLARAAGWRLNGSGAIDALARIGALACGRVGVITRPEAEIVALHPAVDVEASELVAAAASISQSSHGIWARALLRYAVARKMRLAPITEWSDEFQETGHGLRALTQGGQVLIAGSRDWVAGQGIRTSLLETQERESLTPGRRALWVAQLSPAPILIGIVVAGERLKPGGSEMCKNAKRFGLIGALLDRRSVAGGAELAKYLGLRLVEDDALARKATATEWSTLGVRAAIAQHSGDPALEAPRGPRLLLGVRFRAGDMQAIAGSWAAATAREDPRLILDLLRIARGTCRREWLGFLVAYLFCLPGLWQIATGHGSAALLVLGALIGLVGAVINAQLLGLTPTTATEIDEE